MLQPDLRSNAGCVQYVESTVLPQVVRAFALNQRCASFGVVFALHLNGARLTEPHATAVALHGLSGRDSRRHMTQVVDRVQAIGSVFVRQDEFKQRGSDKEVSAIVVQLEHKTFTDLTWTAYHAATLEPWIGPVEINTSPVQVKALRFLASRWMS